jgi:hypothetical protein
LVNALPFASEIFAPLRCGTCQRIPSAAALAQGRRFQVCSLCEDPAVGRFCCRTPCFGAFWLGGHKGTCAGRHKLNTSPKGRKKAAAAVADTADPPAGAESGAP